MSGFVARWPEQKDGHVCHPPQALTGGADYDPVTVWECHVCKRQWIVTGSRGWRRKWFRVSSPTDRPGYYPPPGFGVEDRARMDERG